MGPLSVGFKRKKRPRGTKSEAAAVIMNWGTLGDTKRIKQHRFHRGPVRGEGLFARILQFSMLAGSGKRIKKKKHGLSFFPIPTKHPTGVRQKWFPPMYVASLGAILSKIQGFYESCWAPAPAPAPVIDYLILFPEALGAASRARFLFKKQHQRPKRHPRI